VTPPSSSPSSAHGSPDRNPEGQNDHSSLTREKIDISSLEEREEIADTEWLKVPKFLKIAYGLLEATKVFLDIYELIKTFLHRH
jgi:hypothetical protein